MVSKNKKNKLTEGDDMKFENIRVGDVVFRELSIVDGFSHVERFWIPRNVQAVTPKQFKVDGKKFWKENGSQIGGDSFDSCKNLGDQAGYDRTVEDESVKYLNYKRMIERTGYVRGLLAKRFESGNKNIDEIWAQMIELQTLIKEGLSDD
jgi:hypothetical protein